MIMTGNNLGSDLFLLIPLCKGGFFFGRITVGSNSPPPSWTKFGLVWLSAVVGSRSSSTFNVGIGPQWLELTLTPQSAVVFTMLAFIFHMFTMSHEHDLNVLRRMTKHILKSTLTLFRCVYLQAYTLVI